MEDLAASLAGCVWAAASAGAGAGVNAKMMMDAIEQHRIRIAGALDFMSVVPISG
jgi:hypothetical protein